MLCAGQLYRTFIRNWGMATSAEDFHGQLVVWRPRLCVVEFQMFMTLGEEDLLFVKEGRPEQSEKHWLNRQHSSTCESLSAAARQCHIQ